VFKITNQQRKTVFWTVYRLPCATQSIIYIIRNEGCCSHLRLSLFLRLEMEKEEKTKINGLE